ALHTVEKVFPLRFAPEIVTHEEAAAQKIFAELLHLIVGQTPLAHLHRIEPRVVEGVVAIVEVDRLFDGTNVQPGEAPYGFRKMPVCAGIILRPDGEAFAPVAAAPESVPAADAS